jgi:hypothetical protein
VHSGRTFSGGAAAGVVGDVGGGRDGAPWPFGCRAVMIAHACVPDRFNMVGLASQQWMPLIAFNVRGARYFWERGSAGSINRRKRERESLTSPLSIHSFGFSPSSLPRALPILLLPASLSIRHLPSFQLSTAMAPPQPIVVLGLILGPGRR